MTDPEIYRRKAEVLLREAAQTTNMLERGRLIDEAMYWHNLALEATGHPATRLADHFADNDDDDDGLEATGG